MLADGPKRGGAARKAKRNPNRLDGVRGSGSATVGASPAKAKARRSAASPAVKVRRELRPVSGAGMARSGVLGRVEAKKDDGWLERAAKFGLDRTLGQALPSVPRKVITGSVKQVPGLVDAARRGYEASNRAKGGGGGRRGPLGVPVMATSTPSKTLATQKAAQSIIKNAPKDAKDIALSTPPSLYYLGKAAVTEPEKVPGMVTDPYKQWLEDPGKFTTEKPVSTFFMFAPPAKAGSLGVGRVARQGGKQTLDGGVRGVQGFAVQQPITKPRGVVGNAIATARGKRGPSVAPATEVKQLTVRKDGEGVISHQVRKVRNVSASRAIRNTAGVTKSKYSPQTPLTELELSRLVDKWEGYKNRTYREVGQAAAQVVRDENPLPKRRDGRKARKVAKAERSEKIEAATAEAFKNVGSVLEREFVEKFGATGRPTRSAVERDRLADVRADKERAVEDAARAAGEAKADLELQVAKSQARSQSQRTSPQLERAKVRLAAARRELASRERQGVVPSKWTQVLEGNVKAAEARSRQGGRDVRRAELGQAEHRGRKSVLQQGTGAKVGGYGDVLHAGNVEGATSSLGRTRAAGEVHADRLKRARRRDEKAAAENRRAARKVVQDLERQVARIESELTRTPSVRRRGKNMRSPQDQLFDAMNVEHQAFRALGDAKRAAEAAAREHKQFKRDRANAPVAETGSRVGQVFDHKTDAVHVAERSAAPAKVVKVGDEGWGVVPATMKSQARQHRVVGTSKSTGAVLMRKLRKAFTETVLPYRPVKWLTGQAVEPAVRGAAAGVRPGDGARLRYFVDALNERQPGLGDAFRRDTLTGGQGGMLHDLDVDVPTLGEVARDSNRIHEGSLKHRTMTGISGAAASRPVRAVKRGHDWYVDQIFRNINSRGLERPWQDAFGGNALRQLPELERKLGKGGRGNRKTLDDLADLFAKDPKALDRASQRVKKQVEYDYGKYADFSPGMREGLAHWAPFAPWAINAGKWVPTVGVKRPVVGMTVSTAHNASEDWRGEHGLSSYKGKARPWWQRSAIPFTDNYTLNVGKYGPWGIASDPVNTAGGQLLPFVAPAWASLMYGVDWKGNKIYGKDGKELPPEKRLAYAIAQAAKANMGPVGTIDDLGNYSDRLITGRDKKGTVLENLESQVNIFKSLEKSAAQAEKRKKNRKARRKAEKSYSDLVREYREGVAEQQAEPNYSDLVQQYQNGEW